MGIAILTSSNAAWPWSTTGGQTTVTAELLGGGGGGGGVSNNTEEAGGGGRAGAYVRVTLTKGAETTLNITVGALGAAGAAAGGNGGDGGFSEINQNASVVARAPGGAGGVGGTTNAGHAGGTTENGTEVHTGGSYFAGGSGASGDIASNFSGGGGGAAGPSSAGTTATTQTGGAKGTGTWADGSTTRHTAGADGRTTANAGQTPADFGGGGSGGYATGATNRAGGAGAAGIVVLTWVDLKPSWRDLGELNSQQTVAPRKLDARGFDWGAFFSISAILPTGPTGQGAGHEGRPTGQTFRSYVPVERTAGPASVFTTVVDRIVGSWIPATAALLACAVTPVAAATDDVRYTAPPSAVIQPPAAGPTADQLAGVWDHGGTLGARRGIDFRLYEWTPQTGWIFTTLPAPGPTGTGAGHDGRPTGQAFRQYVPVERTTGPQPAWIFTALPAGGGPTTAQTLPAFSPAAQFRTRTAPILEVQRQSWQPLFGVPDDPKNWPTLWDTGGRTTDRPRLDVRAVDQPGPAWIFTNLPVAGAPTTDQLAGLWDHGGRTPRRPLLDVRAYEWQWLSRPPTLTDAQSAGDWTHGGLTATRPPLDLRTYDWQPSQAWIFNIVPAIPTHTLAGLWDHGGLTGRAAVLDVRRYDWQQLGQVPPLTASQLAGDWEHGGRTAARARLDVRQYDWAPDASPWIRQTLITVTAAQLAAIWEHGGLLARRPRLDVRGYDWQPPFTWATRLVDLVVAKWAPIWATELASERVRPRSVDVRESVWDNTWKITVIDVGTPPHGQTFVRWLSMRLTQSDTLRTTGGTTTRGVDA